MKLQIGDRTIGENEPCFIIAEAGVNHNGELGLAEELIDVAADAGADAIKFQTFTAEKLVTPMAEKAAYQKKNDGNGSTQYEMLKRLEFSEKDFRKLSAYAKKRGLVFLSTAFDDGSLELLIRLKVPAFKVPSGEITNFPYLKKIGALKRPVILSTGMADMREVEEAIACLREQGCTEIALLHCTTSYPAPLESVNLRVMDRFRECFRLPTGYSDHTEGILVAIAAVARGACIVEKHITTDRSLPGPDHAASLEPDDLREMISSIRRVEKALGSPEKKPDACEYANRGIVRKSVVAAVDIPEGSLLTDRLLTLKRPGTGLEPRHLQDLVGRRTRKEIRRDTLILWDMIE